MHRCYRCLLWLALCLPVSTGAQTPTNTVTATNTTATALGPTSAVAVWTTAYIGPQTIQVGAFGLCTASCTIGTGGTCGASPPVLTGCAGGTPWPIAAGGVNYDTLVLTQIAVAQATPQPVPLGPWLPLGSALAVFLLAVLWRRQRHS